MPNAEVASERSDAAAAGRSERRFFAVALWLCAAGAAILLLCPAAFNRRVLMLEAERAETEARRQFTHNAALERWRDSLESDPSVVESEARSNGYGRADEKPYPITAAEWKAARARLVAAAPAVREPVSEPSAVGQAILPTLMLILLGAAAVLFFLRPESARAGSPTMKRRGGYRDKIIRNYYENREDLMIQSLSEVVSELYLASNDRARAGLWRRAETAMRNLKVAEPEIARIIQNHDLGALAKLVSREF